MENVKENQELKAKIEALKLRHSDEVRFYRNNLKLLKEQERIIMELEKQLFEYEKPKTEITGLVKKEEK